MTFASSGAKRRARLQGTREWAFAEILKWLDDPASPQLFWLMGGGGTGKSVLTAELLDRVIHRTVAWHFCRHDNPAQSAPGSLLRSLAAMLAHLLPGYKENLEATGVRAEVVDDPVVLFKALFETPLLVSKVQAPERPLLVILDARALARSTSCPRSRRSRCWTSSPASSLCCRRGSSSS